MPRDGCAVLVVDDDRINRALLSKLLEHEGYRPRTAVNGREALAALGEEPFDAVLLDIVMPEVDGLEVLRTLKADARLWHIPVIVISGLEDIESIVSCLELGADDYVQKPFDPVLLRARLNACLARRQFHVLEVEYQKVVQEQAAELEELRRDASGPTGATGTGDTVPGGGEAGARRATVAVLAVAMGGLNDSTTVGDPTSALAVVDAFQATVGALADRFDGAFSARAAETLMVVFGGLRPSPDPAAAGLGMAGALEEEMTALWSGWGHRYRTSPTWAAGLAVGDAVVGVVASHFAAVGPVVDRAARLRDLAPAGGVLIDDGAFAAAQRRLDDDRLHVEHWEEAGEAAPAAYRLRRRHPHPGGQAPPEPAPVKPG